MIINSRRLRLIASCAVEILLMNTLQAGPPPSPSPEPTRADHSAGDAADGRHDFDFLMGGWRIHNRRLARRLEGCVEWQEFEATQEARPVLGGLGNVDRFTATFPDGRPIEGMTLRIFNPTTQLWSLYWVDDRGCELQPPLVGRFEAGRGEFSGDDTFKGKPIRVLFRWTVLGPNAARWEQAFSPDGGKSWETNWEMTMTRVAP